MKPPPSLSFHPPPTLSPQVLNSPARLEVLARMRLWQTVFGTEFLDTKKFKLDNNSVINLTLFSFTSVYSRQQSWRLYRCNPRHSICLKVSCSLERRQKKSPYFIIWKRGIFLWFKKLGEWWVAPFGVRSWRMKRKKERKKERKRAVFIPPLNY